LEKVFGDFPWVVRTRLPELEPERDRVSAIVVAEFDAWTPPKGNYSFEVQSRDPFFARLYDRFMRECETYFEPFTLHPASKSACFSYVQNNARGTSIWHDHLHSSTVNGVYYLSVPDPMGALWFMFREQVIKTTPEEGWLYLFPRWLLHKPVAQRASAHRISLNVELISNECPISRDEGVRW
jgi:hypothetical protein